MSEASLSSLGPKLRLKAKNPRGRAWDLSVVTGSAAAFMHDMHEPSPVARKNPAVAYRLGNRGSCQYQLRAVRILTRQADLP